MGVYLVADTRERMVLDHLRAVCAANGMGGPVVHQINTGDYLVCQKKGGEDEVRVLACIERKTLTDFASSFKDGRHENRKKMIDFREKTGCQLYYFVEGPAFPARGRKFARIPYLSILSSMTNMMTRDGIFVVQTPDAKGTAARICDFVKSYVRVNNTKPSTPLTATDSSPGDTTGDQGEENSMDETTADGSAASKVPDAVKGVIPKTVDRIAVETWAKLPGISQTTARYLTTQFSVADVANKLVSDEKINSLRTESGRVLKKQAKGSLYLVAAGDPSIEKRILTGVPGISANISDSIITTWRLSEIVGKTKQEVATCQIVQKNRTTCLGAARADRILQTLQFKQTT